MNKVDSTKINVSAAAAVEKQIINEGALDRIATLAREQTAGQFGTSDAAEWCAAILCLRTAVRILLAQIKTKTGEFSGRHRVMARQLALLEMIRSVPKMVKQITAEEINAQKGKFGL